MKRVKNMIRSVWIRAQCMMHDNRRISVIELILVLVEIFIIKICVYDVYLREQSGN